MHLGDRGALLCTFCRQGYAGVGFVHLGDRGALLCFAGRVMV